MEKEVMVSLVVTKLKVTLVIRPLKKEWGLRCCFLSCKPSCDLNPGPYAY